jgi:hypothetical protein
MFWKVFTPIFTTKLNLRNVRLFQCVIVFSIFRVLNIYNLFSAQISKKYLCDIFKPKTQKWKLLKEPTINQTTTTQKFPFLIDPSVFYVKYYDIFSQKYFLKLTFMLSFADNVLKKPVHFIVHFIITPKIPGNKKTFGQFSRAYPFFLVYRAWLRMMNNTFLSITHVYCT